jgi:hypothetical protein
MCAQLSASQATSDGAERVLALGRLSMSYTIGSVLGPILGKQSSYSTFQIINSVM